jgi:two-component system sensor histidine kinase/response regulator
MKKEPTKDELKKKIREQESLINKLVENEKKLHSFFNQAGISTCMIDSDSGQIVEFNDIAHENLGYSREEFEKLTIYDIDGSVNKGSISKRCKEEEGGLRVFETLHRTKDGDLKNMLINYVPVQVDGKRMIQSIHIDVTAQKAVEMALM